VNGIDPSGHDTVIIGLNAEFTPVIGVARGFGIRIDVPTDGQGRFDIILMGNVSGRAGLSAGVDTSWDWFSTTLAPMKSKTGGDLTIDGSICIKIACQGVSKSIRKTATSQRGKVEMNSEVSIEVPKVKLPTTIGAKVGVSVGLTAKGDISLRNSLRAAANTVSSFFNNLFGG
jgi:hypothetical protein